MNTEVREKMKVFNKLSFNDNILDLKRISPGPIIPLIYQYNLLSDEIRVEGFYKAINKVVKTGDIVADLGSGVGLLSHLASKIAKKVYSVEVEPNIMDRGIKILNENKINNVKYILGDSRSISLPERVDVVICEMCSTAFVSELQVSVINNALKNHLKLKGTVIPYSAKTTMQLVHTDYIFGNSVFKLSHFEAYGSRDSLSLSDEIPYDKINFQRINPEFVNKEVILTTTSDGVFNGIRIKTYVKTAKEFNYILPSQWFNPPVVLPTEDIYIKKGQKIKVQIKYPLGEGWSNVQFELVRE